MSHELTSEASYLHSEAIKKWRPPINHEKAFSRTCYVETVKYLLHEISGLNEEFQSDTLLIALLTRYGGLRYVHAYYEFRTERGYLSNNQLLEDL